jgi:hypothetical protein
MSADEQAYEPPDVREIGSDDGPAVTAAGDSQTCGAEWRALSDENADEKADR